MFIGKVKKTNCVDIFLTVRNMHIRHPLKYADLSIHTHSETDSVVSRIWDESCTNNQFSLVAAV